MTKQDAARGKPASHYPYARGRAEKAGLSAELAAANERIVNAEEAARLDPFDTDAAGEYADAVQARTRLHEVARPAVPTPSGDAIRDGDGG